MDRLRVPLVLPVRDVTWLGFKRLAEREGRKLSEIAELTLQWSVAQLKAAGSINRLMECKIHACARDVRAPDHQEGRPS